MLTKIINTLTTSTCMLHVWGVESPNGASICNLARKQCRQTFNFMCQNLLRLRIEMILRIEEMDALSQFWLHKWIRSGRWSAHHSSLPSHFSWSITISGRERLTLARKKHFFLQLESSEISIKFIINSRFSLIFRFKFLQIR